MGVEEQVRAMVGSAIAGLIREGALPPEVSGSTFSVERPKQPEHGDLATNAALSLQKAAKKRPREIAEMLRERLAKVDAITSVEIAGPGFLNLRLAAAPFHRVLAEVLGAGAAYGRGPAGTQGRVQVEFVSANPTGPLLVSHGRGAIVGDAIANLLEATGHRVCREYYVNDYGNQVRLFASSVKAAALGQPTPEGGYGGDYVKELAGWVVANAKDVLDDADPSALARTCVTRMLDGVPGSKVLPGIKQTLADLGVHHDVWFSEESLHRWGRVRGALAELSAGGHLSTLPDGAVVFKLAGEGAEEDKERVVRKQNGETTYFAGDIAYHLDKLRRGYDRLVVVLGADHHGYTQRIRNVLMALAPSGWDPKERFEPVLLQLVKLLRDGQPVKMGKRLGNLVTVEEIVEEIDEAARRKGAGTDALRYFYLCRRSDTSIELDIELAKKRSLDNPVFYLQMGYARLCSIQRRGADVFGLRAPALSDVHIGKLVHPDELAILATLGRFPTVVADAAAYREPHRVIFFLQELSHAFQSYFTRLKNEGDAILPLTAQTREPGWEARWDKDKSAARLAWIEAIRVVYAAGLGLAGITALEAMQRLDEKDEEADG